MCGWLKERASHFKGSVWDESLEIHKTQRQWWKTDKKKKGAEVCLSASRWSAKGLVIPSNHILLLGQFTPSLSHALPPSPPTPWCGSAFTPHTHILHPDTSVREQRGAHTYTRSHLYMDTYMHAGTHPHTQSLAEAVKICSDLVRRHGTRHACNVQCHDNSETPKTAPPPSFPPRLSCGGVIALEAGNS